MDDDRFDALTKRLGRVLRRELLRLSMRDGRGEGITRPPDWR